jgi:hypothetical protein
MPVLEYAQRGPMTPIMRRVRAYVAPVVRTLHTPTVFDAAKYPLFPLDAPPPPWIDCGWIKEFRRSSSSKIEPLVAGQKGMAQGNARSLYTAQVEFEFAQWGKLQMAISSGSQQMNLLEEAAGASGRPSGDTAAATCPLNAGSTATELMVGTANVSAFVAGQIVAVDRDFTLAGYVGAGIAGAFVRNAADVGGNADYTRRVTFNVARIRSVTANSLLLAQPLIAGTPTLDMSVQRVIGFVDREGGSFFQEFSVLFVAEGQSGGRVYYHYPRMQTSAPAAEARQEIAAGMDALRLRATLIALPTIDANDNEQVLCYRSYVPAVTAGVF